MTRTLFTLLTILSFALIMGVGCSSNSHNPIQSPANQCDFLLPVPDSPENITNHSMMGIWSVNFNLDSLTSTLAPLREAGAHYNVTSYLPTPAIHINSYNPTTKIVDVDVTISNPFPINAYDVRLILYTDSVGHKLLNDDGWTDLYEKAGGLPINPFKAYVSGSVNRMFPAQSQQTGNLQVYLPGGNPKVTFAIDASYPGNCTEPYMIGKFTQINPVYDVVGSVGRTEVEINDWQNDVNAAYFYCPVITGVNLVKITPVSGILWGFNLINATGASAGQYDAVVAGLSAGSGILPLYDFVKVTITH